MAWALLRTRAPSSYGSNGHMSKCVVECVFPARRSIRRFAVPTPVHMSPQSTGRGRKPTIEREVIVSVLESSATRRDAKAYLQKYASGNPAAPRSANSPPPLLQGRQAQAVRAVGKTPPVNVAIVKLRAPQQLPQETLNGIAKTLFQLRVLGLLAIVVLDCDVKSSGQLQDEALRVCEAVDSYFNQPCTKLASNILALRPSESAPRGLAPIFSDRMHVDDGGLLERALNHGMIVVAPCLARRGHVSVAQPAEAREVVVALTKYLYGIQFEKLEQDAAGYGRPKKLASMERLILLEPLGGIPMPDQPSVCHRFINLEQEYGSLVDSLTAPPASGMQRRGEDEDARQIHAENLTLARDILSVLPPSSSVLVTTPQEAASMGSLCHDQAETMPNSSRPMLGLTAGMVTTRRRRNPLLHNLLTDRPVSSPSLPLDKLRGGTPAYYPATDLGEATLIKRGLPVTIYPDPKANPWRPPKPGSERLRLTDNCIDLPRLVHLIEDSFSRKLDVQSYLDRVGQNLAGIIIAGEYEGGAILTWERAPDVDEHEAYAQGKLVPYLDKFAVLRNRQGSGGVADIVFNAMVRDCFPGGVCWRSRKDNLVNKWYFERSAGTCSLSKSNWVMFWTTQGLGGKYPGVLGDYETICRGLRSSWADKAGA